MNHRVLRLLNSTGDKYAHLPDIAGWLKKDDSKIGVTFLLLTGKIYIYLLCDMSNKLHPYFII
jgi:ethanolaminephosphotransferase